MRHDRTIKTNSRWLLYIMEGSPMTEFMCWLHLCLNIAYCVARWHGKNYQGYDGTSRDQRGALTDTFRAKLFATNQCSHVICNVQMPTESTVPVSISIRLLHTYIIARATETLISQESYSETTTLGIHAMRPPTHTITLRIFPPSNSKILHGSLMVSLAKHGPDFNPCLMGLVGP